MEVIFFYLGAPLISSRSATNDQKQNMSQQQRLSTSSVLGPIRLIFFFCSHFADGNLDLQRVSNDEKQRQELTQLSIVLNQHHWNKYYYLTKNLNIADFVHCVDGGSGDIFKST